MVRLIADRPIDSMLLFKLTLFHFAKYTSAFQKKLNDNPVDSKYLLLFMYSTSKEPFLFIFAGMFIVKIYSYFLRVYLIF
jgi:hypothetical protein